MEWKLDQSIGRDFASCFILNLNHDWLLLVHYVCEYNQYSGFHIIVWIAVNNANYLSDP